MCNSCIQRHCSYRIIIAVLGAAGGELDMLFICDHISGRGPALPEPPAMKIGDGLEMMGVAIYLILFRNVPPTRTRCTT